MGAAALTPVDHDYLRLAEEFDSRLVTHTDESRSLDDSLERCWLVLDVLPRQELSMLPAELVESRSGWRRL